MGDEIIYLERYNWENKELETVSVRENQIKEIFYIDLEYASFNEVVDKLNQIRNDSVEASLDLDTEILYGEPRTNLEISAWREMTSEEITWRDKAFRSKGMEI
jgi:hypothetical protein